MIRNKTALEIKSDIEVIISLHIRSITKARNAILEHHGTTLNTIVMQHQLDRLQTVKDEILDLATIKGEN